MNLVDVKNVFPISFKNDVDLCHDVELHLNTYMFVICLYLCIIMTGICVIWQYMYCICSLVISTLNVGYRTDYIATIENAQRPLLSLRSTKSKWIRIILYIGISTLVMVISLKPGHLYAVFWQVRYFRWYLELKRLAVWVCYSWS